MRKDVLKSSDLRLYKKLESENKCDDTRYYGVFIKSDKNERRIKVDAVRFNKFFHLSEATLVSEKNDYYEFCSFISARSGRNCG